MTESEMTAEHIAELRPRLFPGAVFSTPFESGCVVIDAPNERGELVAADSEGVLCTFSLVVGGMPLTLLEHDVRSWSWERLEGAQAERHDRPAELAIIRAEIRRREQLEIADDLRAAQDELERFLADRVEGWRPRPGEGPSLLREYARLMRLVADEAQALATWEGGAS